MTVHRRSPVRRSVVHRSDAHRSGAAGTPARWALRGVLAAAFAGMGVLHFVPGPAKGMAAMLPPAVIRMPGATPQRVVRFTGLCELAGAAGLLWPGRRLRRTAGAALVVFLGAVFPANARAASDPERFGPLATPVLPRLAGQVVLAALVLLAAD